MWGHWNPPEDERLQQPKGLELNQWCLWHWVRGKIMKGWQLQPASENTFFNSTVTKTNVVFLLAAAGEFADVFSS